MCCKATTSFPRLGKNTLRKSLATDFRGLKRPRKKLATDYKVLIIREVIVVGPKE